MPESSLVIGHLYPDIMNLYGDRGNVLCLKNRCEWRQIAVELVSIGLGQAVNPDSFDILFMGGGQDREQRLVAEDLLANKGASIRKAIDDGVVALAICGGFQLFGQYYRPAEGNELKGIEVFAAHTIHRGTPTPRCIGNVILEWDNTTLVGFENHGGLTYLDRGTQPLGKVLKGFGNNAEDHSEGAIYKNAFGSYLHGPFLPKNPVFADHLIGLALQRKFGMIRLPSLDDSLEMAAHNTAMAIAERN